MKLVAAIAVAALLLLVPAAEARISLAEVKRENRETIRAHCFDRCIEAKVRYCKRVGADRARCVGRVTWEDHAGVQTCRITNRFKQKQGNVEIYEINKRCNPA